jgi:hypothetical protein
VDIDASIAADLRSKALTVRLDRAASELFEALRRADIDSLLLKGPATARVLFQGESRRYNDIDMLVHPADFERASAVATSVGFAPRNTGETRSLITRWSEFQERAFDRASDSTTLDLHRTFHLVPRGCDLLTFLGKRSDQLTLGGIEVRVPDAPSVCLLALLHAKSARHRGAPSARLSSDVTRVLEFLTDETWPLVIESATTLRVERAIAAVLTELGGAAGALVVARFMSGVRPDRSLTAHLRTGSIVAFEFCQSRAFPLPKRLAWLAMRLFGPLWPRSTMGEGRSGADAQSRPFASDLWDFVRVAIRPAKRDDF